MPRHIAYKRTQQTYEGLKGKILRLRNYRGDLVTGISWFVPPLTIHQGKVTLLTVPTGNTVYENWSTLARWVDEGRLVVETVVMEGANV